MIEYVLPPNNVTCRALLYCIRVCPVTWVGVWSWSASTGIILSLSTKNLIASLVTPVLCFSVHRLWAGCVIILFHLTRCFGWPQRVRQGFLYSLNCTVSKVALSTRASQLDPVHTIRSRSSINKAFQIVRSLD